MRRVITIRWTIIAALFCCAWGQPRAQNLHQPDSVATQPAAKRQGFFDYALGKINPQDKDYGVTAEAGRSLMVEETIDDLYFWSNVVTLILLCGLTAIVLFQWRSGDKRELIAASLIAQLWNGRVSDRIEIDRRTEQFNRLVETHNSEVERTLSQGSKPSEQEAQEAGKLTKSVRNLAGAGAKAAPQKPSKENSTPVLAPDASLASLQQNNLLLQRRVEALQNSEQNLKQRLNQTTVLLDQERRRNATLKGA